MTFQEVVLTFGVESVTGFSELVDHAANSSPAVVGVLLKAGHDGLGDLFINLWKKLADIFGREIDVVQHAFQSICGRPGKLTAVHFVTGDGVRENIQTLVSRLAQDQFWRHVVCGSGSVAWFAELRSAGDHQSEVDNLDDIVVGNNDISRAEIAVNPFVVVEVIETFTDLNAVPDAVFFHSFVLSFHEVAHADSLDEFHDEIFFVVCRDTKAESLHDIRVMKDRGDFSFGRLDHTHKSLLQPEQFRSVQNLDGDDIVIERVSCLPDFGHAPLTDSIMQLKPFVDFNFVDFRFLVEEVF